MAAEVKPEIVGAAQAAAPRYLFDGEGAVFEQFAGDGQALGGQPAQRSGAGFGEEPAGKGPLGHAGVAGEVAHRHGRGKAVLRPGPGGCQRCACLSLDWLPDVLGLAAVAVRGDHHLPGHRVRGTGAVVGPDQVQAQVDPRRHPGRGEHLALVDVQDVGVDGHGQE